MRPDEPEDSRREQDGLFRQEALAEQQDRWLGTVLVVPRISQSLIVGFIALVLAGVVALFAGGDYTRKARLGGWLAPEQGLIQIVTPLPGVLTQFQATEGLEVAAGTTVAVLSAERRSEAVGATQGEVVRQLLARRESLRAERRQYEDLFAQQAAALRQRLAALEAEAGDLDGEIELQHERLELSRKAVAWQRDLRNRDIGLERELQAAQEGALDQALALQSLERVRTALGRSRLELSAELEELPHRRDLQLAETDRATAELDQQLAEAEAARQIVITAPEAGTVTALQAFPGKSVGPDEPLLTLVPVGSKLEARLYGPSRAIGFVRPGQRAQLRYEAFPHQKFGRYEGVVRSVSRSTIGPAELSDEVARLPGLVPGEPVYRITVELAAQTATAYGEAVPLQPGMQLEADILIETRRIYQWVLDPLYSLTGRGRA
jgi:membrane fusion protein